MEFSVAFPRGGSSSTVALHPLNLEVLIFVEGGKPENPEKNPQSRDKNQQQTQLTCDAGSGNRTRATAVGGECSHHCAISAPQTGNISADSLSLSQCRSHRAQAIKN